MADPIRPEDQEVPKKIVQNDSPEPKPQAPAPKQKKVEEDKDENVEREATDYKMLDIAWKAYDASKAIQLNLANMVWDNVFKDPYEAAKSAVKDKASELGSAAWNAAGEMGSAAVNAAGELGSAAVNKASEAAYDLRDKFISNSTDYKQSDDNEFELDDMDSDDDNELELDGIDSDEESTNEIKLGGVEPDSDDQENEIEEQDANWSEPDGIPMTSMQKSTSPSPTEDSKNTAAQQGMPKAASSGAKEGANNELAADAAKGMAM